MAALGIGQFECDAGRHELMVLDVRHISNIGRAIERIALAASFLAILAKVRGGRQAKGMTDYQDVILSLVRGDDGLEESKRVLAEKEAAGLTDSDREQLCNALDSIAGGGNAVAAVMKRRISALFRAVLTNEALKGPSDDELATMSVDLALGGHIRELSERLVRLFTLHHAVLGPVYYQLAVGTQEGGDDG